MSIREELILLQNTKKALKDAIEYGEGIIPENTSFAEYSKILIDRFKEIYDRLKYINDGDTYTWTDDLPGYPGYPGAE